MTLILPASTGQVGSDKPRLHALIIGVAHYPHLPGGGGALAEYTFQLRQVRSPKPSALAIADWLFNRYHNQRVPLGSIELLISPAYVEGGQAIEEPTLARIESAAYSWFERCHSDAENIALFYFCGHGVSYKGIDYLLPQDFGDPDPRNHGEVWKNSIDFTTFKTNMQRRCRANTQIFLGDACRDSPQGLEERTPAGVPLIGGNNTAPLPKTTMYLHATVPEQKVHVPDQSEMTCFSQALLYCLNGGGAERTSGSNDWRVTTYTVAGTMMKLTSLVGERYDSEQSPDVRISGKEVLLHQLNLPTVPGRIDCETQKARDQSHIRLVHKLRHTLEKASERGKPRPWYADLEQGDWKIDVDFEEISAVSEEFFVHPPYFEHVVKA